LFFIFNFFSGVTKIPFIFNIAPIEKRENGFYKIASVLLQKIIGMGFVILLQK